MYQIDKDKQLEVLRWMLLNLEGQWLNRSSAVYGVSEASKLTSRVRIAFAKTEIKTLLALLGQKQANSLTDAAEMLQAYFEMVFGARGFQGQFQAVQAAPGGGTRLLVVVKHLAALESLKKAAQAANENPQSACELLWTTWLEALLPEAQLEVIARSLDGKDVYQIDSLNEVFNPAKINAASSSVKLNEPTSPAKVMENVANLVADLPPLPALPDFSTLRNNANQNQPTNPNLKNTNSSKLYSANNIANSLADEDDDEISPIAAALAIPMEAASPAANNLPIPPFFSAANAPDFSTKPSPVTNQKTTALPASLTGLSVDPNTGRDLFSNTFKEQAEATKAAKSRAKNLPLASRMIMSKEAKQLYSKIAAEDVSEPTSVASAVDKIVQRRLAAAIATSPSDFPEAVRVVGGLQGTLNIVVGQKVYESIEEVPASPVLDLLRQSVAEWSENQF